MRVSEKEARSLSAVIGHPFHPMSRPTGKLTAAGAPVAVPSTFSSRFLVIHGRRDSGYICNLDWLTCDNVVIETEHDHASKYS